MQGKGTVCKWVAAPLRVAGLGFHVALMTLQTLQGMHVQPWGYVIVQRGTVYITIDRVDAGGVVA